MLKNLNVRLTLASVIHNISLGNIIIIILMYFSFILVHILLSHFSDELFCSKFISGIKCLMVAKM